MKNSWITLLGEEGKKPYFQNIFEELQKSEKLGQKIMPQEPADIFRALDFFEIQDTKVVFLGQDPYYLQGVADGLAYSTRSKKTPKTLANILEELKKDYPDVNLETNSLNSWAKQGVLLLNIYLTTTTKGALQHKNLGWENFTKACLQAVYEKNKKAVFVILGKQAQSFFEKCDIKSDNVIYLSHPSPLSYRHSFKDSHLFKQINNLLVSNNLKPIVWDLKKEDEDVAISEMIKQINTKH
ncbi:uracil-DNA glycosylase [Mycoplasmopsis ciconiae]|uniref:Uracil-DNA glycosylase n=1 Tax=Mycoplasmopsis ciconiae TaxID=561067 RepID=A0ABU7MLU1_9BACT|nr:uracil-DNA glycosylase [Mycoplasmopsis ciconiae]